MTRTLNDPITIGGITLKNRLIMAPLQQYKGTPEAFAAGHHIEHYGRRAKHVGLIILESTAVSSNGRLWANDIGIYTDRHVEALRKVTDAVHAHDTPVFIQLSHGEENLRRRLRLHWLRRVRLHSTINTACRKNCRQRASITSSGSTVWRQGAV